jgi:hypothetical protein
MATRSVLFLGASVLVMNEDGKSKQEESFRSAISVSMQS